MRLLLIPLLSALVVLPAVAQQLSPMTGTTAAPPTVIRPTTQAGPGSDGSARRPRMSPRERFEAANTTHDGKLTRDQAEAAHMRRIANNFDAIDTGHHGYVTEDEIRAYARTQRAARRAERATARPQ